MIKTGLTLLLAVAGLNVALCQNAQVPDAKATPVLVELFTSEGCSSCPPADALLAKLDGKITSSGQQIIALSEHVTYWNNLGWTDPFSLQFFTDRQNEYANRFAADEVYTPQVVVNGAAQTLGSDGRAVLKAVQQQALPLPLAFHVMSSRPNGKNLSVMFTVSGNVPVGGAEVYAVLADDRDTTSVAHGENAGRTLSHVAVARRIGMGVVLRAGEQTLVSIPMATDLRTQAEGGRRLVLVAQLRGQGRVVGLLSHELPNGDPAQASETSTRLGTLLAR
ncbi:DUF1223 domain-containing protein [Granulicella sp. 5B5]|uniref:DUF1223 domain-containing protein n=1 Tax=Granulicella sp. 5B5 TaxID=1617967 RepID=UPI0015F484CF|nr:DUF1223 domain-containing protein [Granulicella sp. 5B5]